MSERNRYVHQPCAGRDLAVLMREINRIEHKIITEWNAADVMFIMDISGSMRTIYEETQLNLRAAFQILTERYLGMKIGLLQQGVDGDTEDPTWEKRAMILCQPTRDIADFDAGMALLPDKAVGANEWYLNTLHLGVEETHWRCKSRMILVNFGDEAANKYRVGSGNSTLMELYHAAILQLRMNGVVVPMICTHADAWEACETTYTMMAERTGGICLIEPGYEEIVSMVETLSGNAWYQQTPWFKYTDDGRKFQLGIPDAGLSIPALDAIDNRLMLPWYFHEARRAIERIAELNLLPAPGGGLINWDAESPSHLLKLAMGDGSAYGTAGGRATWRRPLADMFDWKFYDVDIGEIYECVRYLKTVVGIADE